MFSFHFENDNISEFYNLYPQENYYHFSYWDIDCKIFVSNNSKTGTFSINIDNVYWNSKERKKFLHQYIHSMLFFHNLSINDTYFESMLSEHIIDCVKQASIKILGL